MRVLAEGSGDRRGLRERVRSKLEGGGWDEVCVLLKCALVMKERPAKHERACKCGILTLGTGFLRVDSESTVLSESGFEAFKEGGFGEGSVLASLRRLVELLSGKG